MAKEFFSDFFAGLGAVKRGGSLLRTYPGLIKWCVIPLVINYAVFGALFFLAAKFIPELTNYILPEGDAWYWDLARFLLQGIGYLIVGAATYFAFIPVAGLIASPFNDMLAEQVGIIKTGFTPEGAGWKNFFSDALFSLKVEVKKLALFAILTGVGIGVGFIPVVQVISPIYILAVGIFTVALEYIDFSMSHRRLPFRDRLGALSADHPGLTLGFGLLPYGIALVPVINLIVLPLIAPLLVVGGGVLYFERIAPRREPAETKEAKGGGKVAAKG